MALIAPKLVEKQQVSVAHELKLQPNCISFILASFMDFLKLAAHKRIQIDADNFTFAESDKKEFTIRQFD